MARRSRMARTFPWEAREASEGWPDDRALYIRKRCGHSSGAGPARPEATALQRGRDRRDRAGHARAARAQARGAARGPLGRLDRLGRARAAGDRGAGARHPGARSASATSRRSPPGGWSGGWPRRARRSRPQTVLLELSNPDVQLEALESERQLTVVPGRPGQPARQARVAAPYPGGAGRAAPSAAYLDARRNAEAAESLAAKELIAANEASRTRDQVEELDTRYKVEQERLQVMTQAADSQLSLQQAQVDRLRDVTQFQRGRVHSMVVMAGRQRHPAGAAARGRASGPRAARRWRGSWSRAGSRRCFASRRRRPRTSPSASPRRSTRATASPGARCGGSTRPCRTGP